MKGKSVSVNLEPELVDRIDRDRRAVPRSKWMNYILYYTREEWLPYDKYRMFNFGMSKLPLLRTTIPPWMFDKVNELRGPLSVNTYLHHVFKETYARWAYVDVYLFSYRHNDVWTDEVNLYLRSPKFYRHK